MREKHQTDVENRMKEKKQRTVLLHLLAVQATCDDINKMFF